MAARLAATVGLCLLGLTINAGEPSKLDSFAFEGVALSTPLSDFKRQKPSAQYVTSNSEEANGLQCYGLVQTPSSSGAFFHFLDGKLYQVQVLYDYERVTKMGGGDKALEKIIGAFGQPDDTQRNDAVIKFIWNKSKRNAEFLMGKTNIVLIVKNSEADALLNERRAKGTTLGF